MPALEMASDPIAAINDFDSWSAHFRPIPSPVKGRSYDGTAYETYGPELDLVLRALQERPGTVWTLLETGEATVLTNGYHHVNRSAYFISEVPYEGDFLEVVLAVDEPSEDALEDE